MTSSDLTKEILGLERKYWQAIKDQDGETAAQLSDDTCIVAGASGVMAFDRKAFIAMMKKEQNYTLESFTLDDDAQVRMLGKDVAVIAYKVHEELTVEGKPVSIDAADASTWVRRDGKWLCAMHTESITGDPFGRDKKKDAKRS